MLATAGWYAGEWGLFAFRAPGAFLGGALLGLAQWLVLRRSLGNAGWWLAISALAWGVAALFTAFALRGSGLGYTQQYVIFHSAIAAMTGLGLAWLTAQPRQPV